MSVQLTSAADLLHTFILFFWQIALVELELPIKWSSFFICFRKLLLTGKSVLYLITNRKVHSRIPRHSTPTCVYTLHSESSSEQSVRTVRAGNHTPTPSASSSWRNPPLAKPYLPLPAYRPLSAQYKMSANPWKVRNLWIWIHLKYRMINDHLILCVGAVFAVLPISWPPATRAASEARRVLFKPWSSWGHGRRPLQMDL